MENEFSYQQIDDFLAGRLGPEENVKFQKKLEDNPAFEEVVSFRFMEKEIEGLLLEEEINSIVRTWKKEENATESSDDELDRRNNRWWWFILIAILMISGVLLITYFSTPVSMKVPSPEVNVKERVVPNGEDNENSNPPIDNSRQSSPPETSTPPKPVAAREYQNRDLALRYAEDFQMYDELFRNTKRSGNSLTLQEKRIDSLIAIKDFQNAVPQMEEMLLRNEEDFIQINYNLGIIYFLQGEYGKAVDHFERIADNLDNEDFNQTEYLLLLSYAANDQNTKAREIAELIVQKGSNSPYSIPAQKILDQLKS